MKLDNLGISLQNWLSYHDAIGKGFMMSESSFKYPFVDYLVNAGNLPVDLIDFEFSHPTFRRRRVDLVIKSGEASNDILQAFEFKVAASRFDRQRLFNDMIRL